MKAKLTFSTATLPGLVQAYAEAEQILPHFYAEPERLRRALDNPETTERAAFLLGQGADMLSVLGCLEDGSPEELEYAGNLLRHMLYTAYKRAENLGFAYGK